MYWLTSEHGGTCPTSYASLIHPLKSVHYVLVVDTCLTGFVEFVGEDVEHQFTVALGIDMPMCLEVQEVFEFSSVDQVAVVSETYSVPIRS